MTAPGPLAITGGRLFDGTGARPLEPANVVVEHGRISAVGPATSVPVPARATIVDAAAKTVMPGLIDMHVHVVLSGEDSLYCWLGTGITTVRDLGGQPDYVLPLRDRIASGERVGPRIFSYGPALNAVPSADQLGPEVAPLISREVRDAEDSERAVENLIERGVDGVKLYAGLGPEMVERLIRAVHGRLPVTGHLSRAWASEAIAAGIDGLEHVYASLYQDLVRPEDRHTRDGGYSLARNPAYWLWLSQGWARADLQADYVQRFIESLVEHRVALSPTTVLITAAIRALNEPGLKHLPAFLTPERRRGLLWELVERAVQPTPGDEAPFKPEGAEPDIGQRSRAHQLEFLAMLHRAGGTIVPGTDTPFAYMMPGFSLHLELAELVEAGIPNNDVLQASTRVAAGTLRRGDDLGTLETGKIADVLILDGDPLVDINATRNVVTVIKEGVPYNPHELLHRVTT